MVQDDSTRPNAGKGSVEGLKNSLYSRKRGEEASDKRAPLGPGEVGAQVTWGGTPPQKSHMRNRFDPFADKPAASSLAKKFLIASAGFFIIALGAAAHFFFRRPYFLASSKIDL